MIGQVLQPALGFFLLCVLVACICILSAGIREALRVEEDDK